MKHHEVILISKTRMEVGLNVTVGSHKFKVRSVSNETDELKKVIRELQDGRVYRVLLAERQTW